MKEKLQESLCFRDLAITTDIGTSRATQAYRIGTNIGRYNIW